MKKTARTLTFAAAALAAALSSVPAAQASGPIRFSVPFKFAAGGAVLAPGNYAVELSEASRVLTLVGLETAIRVPVSAAGVRRTDAQAGGGVLLFERIGGMYVLRNIWNPHRAEGCSLSRPKPGKELAKRGFTTVAMVQAQ